MKRASKFFSDHEKSRIETAVREAEQQTSAEIIPVLATSSGRYDRAEDVCGMWVAMISMSAAWIALQWNGAGTQADWGTTWNQFELPILIGVAVLGFIVGAIVASRVASLRSIFAPPKQMSEEVSAAAARAFFDHRVHHTEGASGLLIYVSLFERRAVVLGDQSVEEALGKEGLDALCEILTSGIAAGDAGSAFCDVIEAAATRLKAPLPRANNDENEHPDSLVFID